MNHASINLGQSRFRAISAQEATNGLFCWAQSIDLFGLPLVSAKRVDIAAQLVAAAANGHRLTVNFVNAHCVNTLKQSSEYASALRASDLILPDGSGVRVAAKLSGKSYLDNLNGTDLFPALCQQAAARGQSIFLLGGMPDVAHKAACRMMEEVDKLEIAGCADGFFEDCEEGALIDLINRSGAGLLLVGFGVPLQEEWIARNRYRLHVPVVMGVGGLFDYYSGGIPRAPAFIRKAGCEWVWRLKMEPRRLGRRYLVGNLTFLGYALHEGWTQRVAKSVFSSAAKRALDIIGSVVALVLLAPIFVAVALAIKIEDRGPVFFKQLRIGENGRSFPMYKFRSMYIDAEARRAALLKDSERDGICFKMRKDPRITRTGKFIRRFSIDELPQLLNVVRGQMSLVGPRPALGVEVSAYQSCAYRRLGGKPGITCIWQVSGRAEIPFRKQLAMDVAYLRKRSLLTDLWLLVRTVPAVLTGRGAY